MHSLFQYTGMSKDVQAFLDIADKSEIESLGLMHEKDTGLYEHG